MIPIQDNKNKGYILAVASSLLVALTFVLTKIILRDVNSETSSLFFIGFGLLSSFLLLGATKKIKELKLLKEYWKPMLALGLLGGAGALMWFYAIDLIGPTVTAFLIRFVTVFTVFWGILFLKERFNKIEILGMAIAIFGAFVITYTSKNFLLSGVITVLVSAFAFSIMQLIVKLYVGKISPFLVNHSRLTLTFLILFIYSLFTQSIQFPTSSVLIFSFIGGVLGGVIGISLFFKALELAELSKVNIIRTMDPFVVAIYSFLILREVPTFNQMVGGFIIVAGILILTFSQYRPRIISRWIP